MCIIYVIPFISHIVFILIILSNRIILKKNASRNANCKYLFIYNLFIIESPYFLTQPEDVVTVAGSDIVLDCQVGGEPVPEVRWAREGTQVCTHDTHVNRL